MQAGRALLVGRDGASTRIIYNALSDRVRDLHVVLEDPPPRMRVAARRARRLGVTAAIGQALFALLIVPELRRRGGRRADRIMAEFGLDASRIPGDVHRVRTVNCREARELFRRIDPSVVVINGTRIIGRKTLSCVDALFLNMHAGITPLYRGVHGGYWALSEGRDDLVGTTVHVVDEGIDTGRVVGQATFSVSPEDSFATYPLLHLAAGLPILLDAVTKSIAGEPIPLSDAPLLPSQLRYHPTIWGYAAARIARGIR
jgi:methionyl-tRNA formyltransferase